MNEPSSNPAVSVSVSSISTLPIEIFDLIITEVVTQDHLATTTLMSVSHFWHDTVMQRPLLWAKVELDLARSENSFLPSYRVARRCIDRSASVELDVTIKIRRSKESCVCARIFDNCAKCGEWINANRTVLEVLSGEQGEHLARWKRLVVFNERELENFRAKWVVEVISPVISLGRTPRLRVLSFVGSFPAHMAFRHTPLLNDLAFPDANDILIGHVGHVRKLAFRKALPVGLSAEAFTSLTHLVLHIPVRCSNLEFPNVTTLDLIDREYEELSLELPILPRVRQISVTTYMVDFLPQLDLSHYPTWKVFSLRYVPMNQNKQPSDPFITVATTFLSSSCAHLEDLNIDQWFIDAVKANVHRFSNLRKILVSGAELERSAWYQSGVPSGGDSIDNTPALGTL
jgi:hypothetical protein